MRPNDFFTGRCAAVPNKAAARERSKPPFRRLPRNRYLAAIL